MKQKSNRWQWLRLAYLLPIIAVSLYTSAETKVDYQTKEESAITLKVKDGKECIGVKAPVGAFFSWLINGRLAERGDVKEDSRWNTTTFCSPDEFMITLDGQEITKNNIPYVPLSSIKELKFLQGEHPRRIELYTRNVSGFDRSEKTDWPSAYKDNVKRWMFVTVEDAATGRLLKGAEVTVAINGNCLDFWKREEAGERYDAVFFLFASGMHMVKNAIRPVGGAGECVWTMINTDFHKPIPVSFGYPYLLQDAPWLETLVNVHSAASTEVQETVVRLLYGEVPFVGKSPFDLTVDMGVHVRSRRIDRKIKQSAKAEKGKD